jgi:predicted flap endonuclease-1-like 5' DNA nuclease
MAVVSSKSFGKDNAQTRGQKGPLIRVKIGEGQYRKMYEADAIAQGLIVGKAQPPAQDKQRQPAQDKQRQPPKEERPADDLSTIQGVGLATARMQAARAITTNDEQRAASAAGKLNFLSSAAQTAIGKWANG